MIRALAVLALALFAGAAHAQTSVSRNCVTLTCAVVADVSTLATGCRFYDGGVQFADVARSGTTCTTPTRNFTAGVHTITAVAYNADGNSPASLALTLTSVAPNPPPAPTNLRLM